ncbi:hypothetical protein [Nocardia sp. NPDC050435]|uniref:hypothetical protein n=1 Tax=Nocardia sp. NPDC050435 TaxID=3155040 RepID=UPI00340B7A6A
MSETDFLETLTLTGDFHNPELAAMAAAHAALAPLDLPARARAMRWLVEVLEVGVCLPPPRSHPRRFR